MLSNSELKKTNKKRISQQENEKDSFTPEKKVMKKAKKPKKVMKKAKKLKKKSGQTKVPEERIRQKIRIEENDNVGLNDIQMKINESKTKKVKTKDKYQN